MDNKSSNTLTCNNTNSNLHKKLSVSKNIDSLKSQSYPIIQDVIGPIYLNTGKNNSINFARVQKVQSKICKNVFDKGNKSSYRIHKDVPDIKFWNQRYYYYSKFDDGIKMDFESNFLIKYYIRLIIL